MRCSSNLTFLFKQRLNKFNVQTKVNLTMKAKLSIATRVYNSKQYVMPVYIRVSVVLSKSLCRKEREKLDITLDSMVVMLARV